MRQDRDREIRDVVDSIAISQLYWYIYKRNQQKQTTPVKNKEPYQPGTLTTKPINGASLNTNVSNDSHNNTEGRVGGTCLFKA